MKARTFNSVMYYANEAWVARVLGMKVNSGIGPDLVDEDKIVEVKFKLIYPGRYTHVSWRALEYQMDYPSEAGKPGYWAVGVYDLKEEISDLKTKNLEVLEGLVNNRELWVINWDWMKQFQPYRQIGRTESSSWDNTLRFAKKNRLPKINFSERVEGGLVNFTEGVDPSKFGF